MYQDKLIYISDSSIPSYSANSIHVMKMCQAFSKQGYNVTLIGKRTREILANVSDTYAFYGVEPTFQIKLFPFAPFFLSGRIYNILIPFFSLSSQGLVYTRSIYAALWYSLFRRKISFEIHEPFHSKNFWLNFIFRHIVKKDSVNRWIVISQPLKRLLTEEFKIDSNLILVAHDGSDVQIDRSVTSLRLKGKFKVGYVGSLLQGKGMEIIYELSKRMNHVDFHVIGGNSIQLAIWNERLGQGQENITFHGQVPPVDCHQYMIQCDILIAPYQREVYVKDSRQANNLAIWMSPLKIFEYMAVGKPIVASDLPVIREILEPGKSGLLCNPDEIDDWVFNINRILVSPDLGVQLGNEARARLGNEFSWDIRSKRIIDFIKN